MGTARAPAPSVSSSGLSARGVNPQHSYQKPTFVREFIPMSLKISIIMPSYNQGQYVDAAIRSVIEQDYEDWELLFFDGGSTDGTLEAVAPYRDRMAHFVSEPDGGQSDGLAKGFSRATGNLLTWLNTDDLLLPGALSGVARAARADPSCEWFLGNVVWIDAEDHILHCRRGERYTPLWPRLGLLTAAGPSAFFSPALYDRVGGLNRDLHYMMDTELWWRFILDGARFRRLRDYTWALRLHANAKVSGHIFRDQDDPRVRATAADQSREAGHIETLIAPHQFVITRAARRGVIAAQKLLSPSYLRSRMESRCWDGRNVGEVFGG